MVFIIKGFWTIVFMLMVKKNKNPNMSIGENDT